MAWLTPPDDIGAKCVKLTIPSDPNWIADFMGCLLSLTYEYNWQQNTPSDMTPAETAQKWLEIYNQIEDGECMTIVEDIEIDGCDIRKKIDGVWVTVGSLLTGISASATTLSAGSSASVALDDCAINFGIPRGNTGATGATGATGPAGLTGPAGPIGPQGAPSQGLYQLEPVTDKDKLCYTAQQLAQDISDDFQDLIQLLDWNITAIFGTIAEVSEAVFSSLPAQVATAELGQILVAQLQILYNTTDASLDYIILQMSDPDVQDLIANFVYCALAKSLRTVDGVTDVVNFETNLISAMGSYYAELLTFGSVDAGFELDFGEALSDLVSASNSVIAGLACSYVLSEIFFLSPLGLKNSWKSVILGYQAQAEFFDDRDCADFDCFQWCYEWNFLTSNGGWTADTRDGTGWNATWVSGQGWKGTGGQPAALAIKKTVVGLQIEKATITFTQGGTVQMTGVGSSIPTAVQQVVTVPQYLTKLEVFKNKTPQPWYITKVQIKGSGTPPALTGGTSC